MNQAMKDAINKIPPERHGTHAFPQPYQECKPDMHGMSLRDYFAAKTLSAMVTATETHSWRSRKDVADRCYLMADAMIEARQE